MLLSQRRLRPVLGALWVVDGLLQLQPQMFTMNMINGVMKPITQGQPTLIAENLKWIVRISTENLTTLNLVIAAVQVVLGVLFLTGKQVRFAVIASIVWALIIWYGGEGMSLLLTGQAGILTGAPGAVLLYPLIGLAVYPITSPPSDNSRPLLSRHGLQLATGGLWILFAVLQLQPFWWEHGQIASSIRGMVGMGGFDSVTFDPIIRSLARHLAGLEVIANLCLILACAAIGIGLLTTSGTRSRPYLAGSVVLAGAIWLFAQAVGGIFTGMATDFNSGLLLIVLGFASWTRKRSANADRIPVAA